MLKTLLRSLFSLLLPGTVENYSRMVKYFLWLEGGRRLPAPGVVKRMTLREYGVHFKTPVLVETGLWLAETMLYCKDDFETLHSIELDPDRVKRGRALLKDAPNVHIHLGDSGELLPQLLNQLNQRTLFWLDAHFPPGEAGQDFAETPIVKELQAIANHPVKDHVILIDDARDFGQGEYPSLEWMHELVINLFPGFIFYVVDDIIRIHAPQPWDRKPF